MSIDEILNNLKYKVNILRLFVDDFSEDEKRMIYPDILDYVSNTNKDFYSKYIIDSLKYIEQIAINNNLFHELREYTSIEFAYDYSKFISELKVSRKILSKLYSKFSDELLNKVYNKKVKK